MWSRELDTTFFELWGVIPAGFNRGNLTVNRSVRFFRDIYLVAIQVSLSFSGLVPVADYYYEMRTNLKYGQGSAISILPAGSPTSDQRYMGSAYSTSVSLFNVGQSHPANEDLTFSGYFYTATALGIQMSCAVWVVLFYNVKQFM